MSVIEHYVSFTNFVIFLLGTVCGIILDRIYARRQDVKFPKFAPHARHLNVRSLIAGLLVVLGIVIFVQSFASQRASERVAIQQAELARADRECNIQFQRALQFRSTTTTQDSDVALRENERRQKDEQAQGALVDAIVDSLATGNQEALATAASVYQSRLAQSRIEAGILNDERAKNNAQRQAAPYPEPSCGAQE